MLKFDFQVNLKKGHRGTVISKQKQSEPHLRILLAAAHQIRRMMQSENIKSYKAVAERLNLSPARVSQIMDLLLLAPSIQGEILLGKRNEIAQLSERTVRELLNAMEWGEQERNMNKAFN